MTHEDAVVIEMTTNTYAVHDALKPFVVSVTVVHPPYVALIVRAQVKTDRKAALTLAQLHAAGLLPGIWIPPVEVRELRALVAQRNKMVRLSSMAKCRLRSLLHRRRILPPGGQRDLLARVPRLVGRTGARSARAHLHAVRPQHAALRARRDRAPGRLPQATGRAG